VLGYDAAKISSTSLTPEIKDADHTVFPSYKVILPGLWPVEFCQALLDFAEQEHDWDLAYGYMKAQYYLRSNDQGPNADKAGVEGFMTEDIVEALAEWRREEEEGEERAAAAAALAEEEARASRRRKRRRLLP